jgi:hypothetical protein
LRILYQKRKLKKQRKGSPKGTMKHPKIILIFILHLEKDMIGQGIVPVHQIYKKDSDK